MDQWIHHMRAGRADAQQDSKDGMLMPHTEALRERSYMTTPEELAYWDGYLMVARDGS